MVVRHSNSSEVCPMSDHFRIHILGNLVTLTTSDDGSDQYYAWDGATWNNVGTALKGQKGAVGDKGEHRSQRCIWRRRRDRNQRCRWCQRCPRFLKAKSAKKAKSALVKKEPVAELQPKAMLVLRAMIGRKGRGRSQRRNRRWSKKVTLVPKASPVPKALIGDKGPEIGQKGATRYPQAYRRRQRSQR